MPRKFLSIDYEYRAGERVGALPVQVEKGRDSSRTKYTDFFDRAKEFDTVNTINAPYSAVGGSTLSPDILRAFASEAKNYSLDSEDFSFCLAALSGNILNADQISFYVERRLKIELPDRDNQTLYDKLCLILQDIKGGGRREIFSSRRRRREIMVD